MALLLGPAIAGILVAALEPVAVLWVTSGTAALAAILTFAVPSRATAHPRERDGAATTRRAGSLFLGLVILFRSPLLRAMLLLGVTLAVVLAATQGMVIPVHFTFQDEPQFVGFVLSALAAGLLVGGGLFAALGSRIPRRTWFVTGAVIVAIGFAVVGILGPVWSIFTGAAIVGLGGGGMNAVVGLTFVENVDEGQRGKVLGAQNAIMTLVPPAGIGAAALLIEFGSLRLATTVFAVLWIIAVTVALFNRRIRRLEQVRV